MLRHATLPVRMVALGVLTLPVATACGDAGTGPPDDTGEPIQTDARSYELERDTLVILGDTFPELAVRIDYVFMNQTERTVYIVQCGGPDVFVERRQADGSWAFFWNGGSESCLSPAIVVEPGQKLSDSFVFGGVEYGVSGFEPSFPVPNSELTGTYRMRIRTVIHLNDPADYPDGPEIEPRFTHSNPFEVRVQ